MVNWPLAFTRHTRGQRILETDVNELQQHLEVADLVAVNALRPDLGIKGDGKRVTDAAITTGTATLTSATAAFISADVGKIVVLIGAGAAGVTLFTTIAAYVNATTVTLAATAGTTVSGAELVYGTGDATAINAILAAAPDGGVITFPKAIYLIEAQPTYSGKKLTLLFEPGARWREASAFTTPILYATAATGSVIRGLTIEGSESIAQLVTNTRYGVEIELSDDVVIERLKITGKSRAALLDRCNEARVDGVRITGLFGATTTSPAGANFHSGLELTSCTHCTVAQVRAKDIGSVILQGSASANTSWGNSYSQIRGRNIFDTAIYISSGDDCDVSQPFILLDAGKTATVGSSAVKCRGTGHRVVGGGCVRAYSGVNLTGNGFTTSITGAHTSSVTTITVADTSAYPAAGTIRTSTGEQITYTGTTATTFTGATRGANGSTATAYVGGEGVGDIYGANGAANVCEGFVARLCVGPGFQTAKDDGLPARDLVYANCQAHSCNTAAGAFGSFHITAGIGLRLTACKVVGHAGTTPAFNIAGAVGQEVLRPILTNCEVVWPVSGAPSTRCGQFSFVIDGKIDGLMLVNTPTVGWRFISATNCTLRGLRGANLNATTTVSVEAGSVNCVVEVSNDWTITTDAGTGTHYIWPQGKLVAASATYTVLATDETILMTTGATDRTVNLPLAARSKNKKVYAKKADPGTAGKVVLDPSGAELIDGAATRTTTDSLAAVCDGVAWFSFAPQGTIT